jgi:hypothetical protein
MWDDDTFCPDCGKKKRNQALRCIICTNKYQKEYMKQYDKKGSKPKEYRIFICCECKNEFETDFNKNIKVKYCSDRCKEIFKNKEKNKDWLQKEKRNYKTVDSNVLERKRAFEEPQQWLLKFKAVRG